MRRQYSRLRVLCREPAPTRPRPSVTRTPQVVQLTKQALNKAIQSRTDEAFDLSFYLGAVSQGSKDVVEAVTLFLEKRRSVWKGR